MSHILRTSSVGTTTALNAALFERDRPGRDTLPAERAEYERAVDIAVRVLAVLAYESALAAVALQEISNALGCRLNNGIVADVGGRFRAYIDGIGLGEFETFDAALEKLHHGLASLGPR